eukprot:s1601_g10.t1
MISDVAVKAARGGWDDKEHQKLCDGQKCFRCGFLARQQKLQRQHSWLCSKYSAAKDRWGLGCKVCSEVQDKDASLMNLYRVDKHHFANFEVCGGDLRLQRFKKHADSPSHEAAVRFMSGGRSKAVEEDDKTAPSYADWLAVLQSKDAKQVARAKKLNVMRWCLASAFRSRIRDFAKEALCISVQQDARGNRFLSRFKMVNSKLEVFEGTLALAKHAATVEQPGSVGIRRRTMLALENLASGTPPPAYSSVKADAVDTSPQKELYRQLLQKVECFAADAAADEQLAGRELSSTPMLAGPDPMPLKDVMEQSLPNLKAGDQASCHWQAAGYVLTEMLRFRMMMRPWKADPVISLIMHQFIEKTNSPAKFITYFPNLQQIYEDLRQRSTEDVKLSKHVHSFAYAPQRYASESQTLCRLVLTIDAVIGMLATVQETRKGCAEAAAAVETLASITTERLLLLSMLGDAALEQYRMVAFLDRSDLDEAEIPEQFLFYHQKLDCMFRKQQILHTAGLTSLMLTKLKEPRSVMLANGQSVNWGGPCAVTPEMLEQCLARMSAYCVLSHKTWQAEFPSFELMANFQCFSCSTKTSASTTSIQNGMLQQLAKIIGVHGPTLQAEYHDLRPVAIKYAKQASLTNYEAWKRAIEITQRQRDNHPADALLPVLARYGCWCSSSSNVERGFSIAKQSRNVGCSQDEHIAREEDLLILNQDVIPQLTEQSQKDLAKTGEAGFLERRAAATDALVITPSASAPTPLTADAVQDVFADSHNQELQFIDSKLKKHKMEAYLQGHLPEGSEHPGILEEAEAYREKLRQNQRERNNEHRLAQRRTDAWGADMTVFVHSSVRDLGFRLVDNPCVTEICKADLLILPDPRAATDDVRFIAGLSGWVLCEPEFVRTRGSKGVAVAFCRAMSTQRKIHVTPRFMGDHTEECRVLLQLLKLQGSKWQPLARQQIFNMMDGALNKQKTNQTIVLCVQEEKDDFLHKLKHVFTMPEALASPIFVSEDRTRCRTGLARGF